MGALPSAPGRGLPTSPQPGGAAPAAGLPAAPTTPTATPAQAAPPAPAAAIAPAIPLPGGKIVSVDEHSQRQQAVDYVNRRDEATYRDLPSVEVVRYERQGVVTVDMLLNATAGAWDHLNPAIIDVTAFVQNRLSEQGKSADIQYAREHPDERDEILRQVDKLALQRINEIGGLSQKIELAYVLGCVENEIVGYGPIEPLLADPDVSEVMVNGPNDIWAEYAGKLKRIPGCRFRDNQHVTLVQQQILMPINRSVNPKNPLEDGRLPDGSRVNAVDGSVGLQGPFLTIRRFPQTVWTIEKLVNNGSMTMEMGLLLAKLVMARCNVLVAGGTGSGKTSLLNSLSSCIPRDERTLTVEDSAELRLHPDGHVLGMEGRPASASGAGAVSIRMLVKNALRMRPERIVVGEVRDAAALDMLQAMNTGHEGSMTTVHANSPSDATQRLTALVKEGSDLPVDNIVYMVASALDIIVYQRRFEDGSRRIESVSEVFDRHPDDPPGYVKVVPLYEWVRTGTNDQGKLVGEYVKRNDPSEALTIKRTLHLRRDLTPHDLHEMSILPDDPPPVPIYVLDDDDADGVDESKG